MEKTASQIQKERTKELEDKACELIKKCDVATLTSINEKGYPRTCVMSIAKAEGFSDIHFSHPSARKSTAKRLTLKRAPKQVFAIFSVATA